METMMKADARTWKASEYITNSIKISSSEEQPNILIVSGYFQANITKWPFRGLRKIKYKAKIEILLGEPSVTKIWWTQPILNTVYCIGECE